MTNRTDALSRQTTFKYDAVGNVTNSVYPSFTNQFAYDALNRLTNVLDAVGTTSFSYDTNGLLATEDGPWANDTVSFAYTTGRQRSSLTLQQPNASAWVQSYLYDGIRRLTNVASPSGSFGYQYSTGAGTPTSASALIKKLSLPGGSYITNTFDSVARLLSTSLKNSSNTVLNSHAYVYDLDGERTKQTFKDGNYLDYTYDTLGQLKTAFGKESGGSSRLHEQFSYNFDAAGNLSQRINNALTNAFGVNNLNQLTNVTRSGTLTVAGTTTSAATNVTVKTSSQTNNVTPYLDNTFGAAGFNLADGNNTFTAIAQDNNNRKDTNAVTINLPASPSYSYDSNGNLLVDGRRTFTYDDENQLNSIIVTNAGGSSTLTTNVYDAIFRRRIRREFSWVNGKWEPAGEVRYVYDGRLVVQERDGNNVPLVSYTRGSDLSGSFQGAAGIGGLLARTDHQSTINYQPSTSYYHADGNGNITALLNDKQLVVARYEYDPFGNILSKSGPLADANLYRFSSQEYHQNSGLLLYLYRAYDPNLQRFINHDPIEELGGMNLYGFVGNNPLGRVDLWGLDEDDPTDPTSDKNLNKNCPTADSGVPNWKSDLSHDTHQFINETGKEMAKSAACSVAGGVVGRGLGALRGKVGCVFKECKRLSKKAARALRKHHSWPKYLGGAEKQDLVPLEKWVHDAYHSGLDKYLPRKRGTEYYEGLKGAERQDALQKLADYTKAFDDVYGTKIYPAMIEEGFPLP